MTVICKLFLALSKKKQQGKTDFIRILNWLSDAGYNQMQKLLIRRFDFAIEVPFHHQSLTIIIFKKESF